MKAQILSGALPSGEKLPPFVRSRTAFGVSVITTKRAYSNLEAEGFIATVQGKGQFL